MGTGEKMIAEEEEGEVDQVKEGTKRFNFKFSNYKRHYNYRKKNYHHDRRDYDRG